MKKLLPILFLLCACQRNVDCVKQGIDTVKIEIIAHPHKFTLAEVLNKMVCYKNGNECKVVGYCLDTQCLLNRWNSGKITTDGRLEDVDDTIN